MRESTLPRRPYDGAEYSKQSGHHVGNEHNDLGNVGHQEQKCDHNQDHWDDFSDNAADLGIGILGQALGPAPDLFFSSLG